MFVSSILNKKSFKLKEFTPFSTFVNHKAPFFVDEKNFSNLKSNLLKMKFDEGMVEFAFCRWIEFVEVRFQLWRSCSLS